MIDNAIAVLYGNSAKLSVASRQFIKDAFAGGNYEQTYLDILEGERQSKKILLDFDKEYPGALKEDNIAAILKQAKQKRRQDT
jgi:hypothetical protein